ncbi:unnamed protein product [Phaeothamnion confervicola]
MERRSRPQGNQRRWSSFEVTAEDVSIVEKAHDRTRCRPESTTARTSGVKQRPLQSPAPGCAVDTAAAGRRSSRVGTSDYPLCRRPAISLLVLAASPGRPPPLLLPEHGRLAKGLLRLPSQYQQEDGKEHHGAQFDLPGRLGY